MRTLTTQVCEYVHQLANKHQAGLASEYKMHVSQSESQDQSMILDRLRAHSDI